MVDLSERVKEIKNDSYVVISTSFGGIGDAGFEDEAAFVKEFCRLLRNITKQEGNYPEALKDNTYNNYA